MIKLKDVMVTDVLTASKTDTLQEVVQQLHKHKIGAIIIISGEKYPVGIVTERDIITALITYKEKILSIQAQDIMTAPVITLTPDDDIESASMMMSLNRIRRIPIVENGLLTGLVSYKDIANALRKSYYMLEEKTEGLEDKANKDSLTGLFNKGYVLEQLKYQTELSLRSGNPFSVIMIDIDHFKKVNDTYGHLAGDEILKRFISFLKNNIGRSLMIRL